MKKVVLIEDEVIYQKPLIDVCRRNGLEVVITITPCRNNSVAEIVAQIIEINPDLILLDHDLCKCGSTTSCCKCFNGQDIFERLGDLKSKVICISRISRNYVPRERTFSFKDCLEEFSVMEDFRVRLGWMFEKA